MVGPVLHQEMLLGTRRNRLYVFRWIYAGWLLLQVLYFSFAAGMATAIGNSTQTTTIGLAADFVPVLITQQIILVFLVTPVFTAGAITDEKSRGTMQYLLTTDLSAWHILLGKMLARLAQVGLVAVTGLPLLFFLGAFASYSFITLLAVVVVTVVPLFCLASLSLLASVWTRQTRDAVLVFFLILGVRFGLLALVAGPSLYSPYYVLQPIMESVDSASVGEFGRRLIGMILLWGSEGLFWFGLATWRLRPACIRQLQGEGRGNRTHWWRIERAAMADSPIPWKERHVDGLSPIQALRRTPLWLGILLTFLATVASSSFLLWLNLPSGVSLGYLLHSIRNLDITDLVSRIAPSEEGFQAQGVVVMLLFSLLVGVRCSGAISGEREKQTWEALLLTPLSARQLIQGKLWGIMGASYYYLIAYAVPALSLSILGGAMSFFWTAMWLAVTFLAMYFVGATGLRCSVRAKSSWRSLLGTVGIGYVGGFIVYAMTSPIILILALVVLLSMILVDRFLGTSVAATATGGGIQGFYLAFKIASCGGLALIFWLLSKYFLRDTQRWVADRERTRHWSEEPISYQPRGRRASIRKQV
jgi:ABC-type transport system involved in multi-copper enzyme maturation permease subunit